MEFDRRRTRWHHIALFLIYVVGVVVLLLNNNQYLYSHIELREKIVGERVESVIPIPKGSKSMGTGEATYWRRGSPERSGHDLLGSPRDKDFVTDWQKTLVENAEDGAVSAWSADTSGVYISGSNKDVFAIGGDGEQRWRYSFAATDAGSSTLEPVLDESAAYLSHSSGIVVALEKANGSLLWRLKVAENILAPPVLIENELWVLVTPLEAEQKRLVDTGESKTSSKKSSKASSAPLQRFVRIQRQSGEISGYSEAFSLSGPAQVSWSRDEKLLVVALDNKVTMVSADEGKIEGSQTLPDAIQGGATLVDGKMFLALTSGKIQAWDLGKSGKFEWELDLSSPPKAAPTYVPLFQRLAVLTADGHMFMIDIKKSESLWRLNLDNRNVSHEIMSARLSGRFIEKLELKWEKKGWTVWSPCSENRICIYNPEKGQLLSRIPAPASVVSGPLFAGKEFYLITRSGKAGDRTYKLVHYIDEDAFKKKAKEAQEAAQTSNKGASQAAETSL